jgi:hypothetical protein
MNPWQVVSGFPGDFSNWGQSGIGIRFAGFRRDGLIISN